MTATRWKPAHRCTRPANYVATVGRLKVDVCYRHVMQERWLVLAKEKRKV